MQMASGFKQTAQWLNGTARRRLILWSISFWVVATSVLCFTFLWVGQGQLLQESRNRNVQLAAFVGRDVNAQVNGITGNIRQFTQHLGMLDPQLDEQANAVLGLRLSSSVYRGVYYFKSDGALLFSLNDPAAALPAIRSSREIVARSVFSVQDVISRVCAAARNTGFSVSEPAYTPLEFTPVLYMGIPLTFSSGESRVVVYEIDLTDIWRRIGSVTVGQTGIAYAVSRTGVIITHPEGSYIGLQASREVRPVLSSYEGYVDYVEPVSRKPVIAAYSPVGGVTGWGVVVQQNRAEITSAMMKTGAPLIGIWSGLSLVGIAGIVLLVTGFTRPIRELTAVAQGIARTGFLTKTGIRARPDEVGQLSNAFDSMIDKITDADGRLTVSEAKYRSLFENANDAIILIDDGRIVDCNRTAEIMFGAGRDAILGKRPSDISAEIQPDGVLSGQKEDSIMQLTLSGEPQRFEWLHRRQNGELFYAEVCLNRMMIDSRPVLMGIIRDVTERKRADEALKHAFDELEARVEERTAELRAEIAQRRVTEDLLRQGEEKYRDLVENASSIILEMDTGGNVTFLNRYGQDFFGFAEEDMLGQNIVGTIVPAMDSYGNDLKFRMADLELHPDRYASNENENVKKNGERVWVAWTNRGIYDRDGVLRAIHCIGIDRTEQVKEAALEAQQAKEEAATAERTRLARELHDAVSQTLFSASLIAEVLPCLWERSQDEGKRRLEEIRQLTRGALAEMRTLLFELRPATLLDVAMPDLLKQLSQAVTGRARIPVLVDVQGECELAPEVKVSLYRICQEALNNVAKHAQATEARISVRCMEGRVELRISDNGQGFDPAAVRPGSLGLGIMRERAGAIGATLEVTSAPGEGTLITVLWQDNT